MIWFDLFSLYILSLQLCSVYSWLVTMVKFSCVLDRKKNRGKDRSIWTLNVCCFTTSPIAYISRLFLVILLLRFLFKNSMEFACVVTGFNFHLFTYWKLFNTPRQRVKPESKWCKNWAYTRVLKYCWNHFIFNIISTFQLSPTVRTIDNSARV